MVASMNAGIPGILELLVHTTARIIMEFASEARLSSQLNAVLGNAEVTIIGASLLEINYSQNVKSMQCGVVVARHGPYVSRQTSLCEYSLYPQWDELFEFKSNQDWDVQFFLSLKTEETENVIVLSSDVIPMQNHGLTKLPLRAGAKHVGELDIFIKFSPHIQSFKYLTIGGYLSEQLPYTMVNQILSELNSSTVPEKMHAISHEQEMISLIAVIDKFTIFLTEEDTFNSNLYMALNGPHLHNSSNNNEDANKSIDSSTSEASTAKPKSLHASLLQKRNSELPRFVPLHKVANGAKVFLSQLMGDLPQAPSVTIGLIEKQLSIFTQCLLLSRSPAMQQQAVAMGMLGGISTGTSADDIDAQELSWSQFSHFCIAASLWFIQQATTANQLVSQCQALSLTELDALRFGFYQYDTELSGTIATSDLFCLLEDMGEKYTETEIGLTATYLDPDNLESINFVDFVHWWCE